MFNIYRIDRIIEFNTYEQSLTSYILYVRKRLEFIHKVSSDLCCVACKITVKQFVYLSKCCSAANRMSAECRSVRTS